MRILVADDDAANRKLLRVTLEEAGHEVLQAADGVEALELLRREPVGGVISDILMPRMDGYRLCHEVRKDGRLRHLPFVIYTQTFTSPSDEGLAGQVGADAYFKKPTSGVLLARALEQIGREPHRRPPQVSERPQDWSVLREYNELLVRKLEEKNRELRQRTEELQRSEERARALAAIVESSDDAIIGKTLDGTITSWNQGAVAMYAFSAEEAIGRTIALVASPEHPEEWRGIIERIRQGEHLAAVDTVRRRKDGAAVAVSLKASPIRDRSGAIVGVSVISRDITERRRAEEDLRESHEQLRALAGRLRAVREEEQIRISREIHDEIGQMLSAIRMDLAWLRGRLAKPQATKDRAAALKKVEAAAQLSDALIQSVQRIAADLRPAVLDSLGLTVALESEARKFQERTGIRCGFDMPEDPPDMGVGEATACYRIFQEILTNVSRHAGASAVRILLARSSAGWVLEVTDNGRGIDAAAVARRDALGLLGMKERALAVGGEVSFEGRPGAGTTVRVRLPHAASKTGGHQ